MAKASPEKVLRWSLQGALVLFVVAVVVAVLLYMQIGQLQASLAQAQQATADANAAGAKTAAQLRDAKARSADSDGKIAAAESLRASLERIQPQLNPILEAAVSAKGAKPDLKASALAAEGIVEQVVHGANSDAGLAKLDQALAQDKGNCAAALATNLSSSKKADVDPGCQPAAVATAAPAAGTPPTPAAPAAAPAPVTPAAPAAAKAPAPAKN